MTSNLISFFKLLRILTHEELIGDAFGDNTYEAYLKKDNIGCA